MLETEIEHNYDKNESLDGKFSVISKAALAKKRNTQFNKGV